MTNIDVKAGYDEVFLSDLSAHHEKVTDRVKPHVFLTFREAIG